MAGSILLTLALVFSIFSMLMYFFTFRGANNTINLARIAYHAMSMLVIVASAYLLYLILTHQYQFKYVFSYSNSDLPLGFLMSTFWAGQEGSFMLWLLLTAIIGIFLQSYTSKRGDLEPRVMSVFALATTFLLTMVSPLLKNPFEYLWVHPIFLDFKNVAPSFLNLPILQNFLFSDPSSGQNFVKMNSELYAVLTNAGISINDFVIHGKGLNPLLQNFWMQIHPPILFIGFAMATVPFAFAIAALMKDDYKDWVRQSFPWVAACAGVLGLGIMLGGYWAYGILGWGGYWAWDPVENSSLVPWIVSVAAIHTMLVQRKTQAKGDTSGKFVKTNLILSIVIYVLVIYSTFLTRSGILGDASVHSFVDPGTVVYLFLVIFISTFILLGAGMIAFRWKSLNEQADHQEGLLSRELALFTAAVTLGASAIIVLVGTSAPIFHQSVDIVFYNEMHVPLAIIIGLLNGLSLILKWKHTDGSEIIKKSRFSIIATVLFTLLVVVFGSVHNLMMILLTLSAAFTLFVNGEIAFKIIKGNKIMLGAYVTHIAFAIFILGVIGSSAYSEEKDLNLIKGESQEIFGYKLKFTGYQPFDNNKKYYFNIDVEKSGREYQVRPVMYVSDFNMGLMREPDIITGVVKDFYVSPSGYEDGSQGGGSHSDVINLSEGQIGDFHGAKILYKEFIKPDMQAMMAGGDFKMGAKLVVEKDGKSLEVESYMQSSAGQINYVEADLKDVGLQLVIGKIDPMSRQAEFTVTDLAEGSSHSEKPAKEVLSVTASIKPFVNLVWIGVIGMFIGFVLSTLRRLKESRL
ncbi:MAG TPA: cytochrome c-type biogenesis CcmF C-terminal domain-containing protein [Ignavibacteriaceae bacterium]|nr:cytochrome c-type biogenesis CcmF C-terminal domain-containing protein [Ignavibacteriaceae bacterium]